MDTAPGLVSYPGKTVKLGARSRPEARTMLTMRHLFLLAAIVIVGSVFMLLPGAQRVGALWILLGFGVMADPVWRMPGKRSVPPTVDRGARGLILAGGVAFIALGAWSLRG